ncbi:MAG: hypothetical protein ACRDRR_09900 [Pseudonocardiaceae bacterium]
MKAVAMNVLMIGPDNDHWSRSQQPMNDPRQSMSGAPGLHLRRLRLV